MTFTPPKPWVSTRFRSVLTSLADHTIMVAVLIMIVPILIIIMMAFADRIETHTVPEPLRMTNQDLWSHAMRHDLGSAADSVEEPVVQPSPVFTLIRRVQADWKVWWVWWVW